MKKDLYYTVRKQNRIIREQERVIRTLNETIAQLLANKNGAVDPCFTCEELVCPIECPYCDNNDLI